MIIEHLRASREAACIFDEQIISLSFQYTQRFVKGETRLFSRNV